MNINRSLSENKTDCYEQLAQQYQLNDSHGNHDDRHRLLKPLKMPTFNGDKSLPFLEKKSIIAVRNWLKDEVSFRVEAAEMANGIESKQVEYVITESTKVPASE